MLKVKICGITNLEDARYCAAAGADFLGFIQYPESPRYVAPEVAREIIEWIHGPEKVGVFVNATPDAVNRAIEEVGFTMVQLHGTEPPEWCAEIDAPVIKAIHVVHDASAEQLRTLMEPYRPWVTYFLLDTHRTNLWGGTGESFNWRLARELSADYPILLAGGIGAHNLEEAVRTMRPLGVDLSSSVEAAPGKKDFDKLARFFEVFHALRKQLEAEAAE
ncbi:phosphoribosylanthranilate isomerase [Rhodothermus marinus]|nr:phosphoribosylanthranilate isomerase [Rhodothermus marinus]AEN73741.1 Phosphoribosylanthranilate isomerase [Rhodothermus marinus SG0.5JP17-172]